jgi:hypothetical protein
MHSDSIMTVQHITNRANTGNKKAKLYTNFHFQLAAQYLFTVPKCFGHNKLEVRGCVYWPVAQKMYNTKEGKGVIVQTMNAYRTHRGTAPLILNLGTGGR